eukprot:GILI01027126.1.p1 GENE.GILI01027126.1~~GILI01027126.1.p1  ORF type:complete len:444 (-),score=44.50 GILI01027126.1:214-1368(-)
MPRPSPLQVLSDFVSYMTTTTEDSLTLGSALENVKSKGVIDGFCPLTCLRQLVCAYSFYGSPIVFYSQELMTLMEEGVVRLHRLDNNLVGSLAEPLVATAVVEFYKDTSNPLEHQLLENMSSFKENSSVVGFLFEYVLPCALRDSFSSSPISDHPLLRDLPNLPPWTRETTLMHPAPGCPLVTHHSKKNTLPMFLVKPQSPCFLPETVAGPDVLSILQSNNGADHRVCLLQCKVQDKLRDVKRAVATTDPAQLYSKKDGTLNLTYQSRREEADRVLGQKYSQGCLRILFAFPDDGGQEQSRVLANGDVLLVIDSSNALSFLTADQHAFIRDLKQNRMMPVDSRTLVSNCSCTVGKCKNCVCAKADRQCQGCPCPPHNCSRQPTA